MNSLVPDFLNNHDAFPLTNFQVPGMRQDMFLPLLQFLVHRMPWYCCAPCFPFCGFLQLHTHTHAQNCTTPFQKLLPAYPTAFLPFCTRVDWDGSETQLFWPDYYLPACQLPTCSAHSTLLHQAPALPTETVLHPQPLPFPIYPPAATLPPTPILIALAVQELTHTYLCYCATYHCPI